MEITKTSEKVLIFLHRKGYTMQFFAKYSDQTRQAVSQKIKGNCLTDSDLAWLRSLGFKG